MDFLLIGGSWIWSAVVYGLIIFVLVLVAIYRASILQFTGEVKAELAKCSWPIEPEQKGTRKYKMLMDSTMVVVVLTLILSAYVACFDLLITSFIGLLINF